MKGPAFSGAVSVYLAYNAVIFATWAAVGADYKNLVGPDVAFAGLVVPLSLGAVLLTAVVTYLGWWRSALFEQSIARPRWSMFLILFGLLGFLVANVSGIKWEALTATHLLTLIAAGILVGFNEELVARGVLVAGARGSGSTELFVWFWSFFLFGLMHLPNMFFGMPLIGGPIQCVLAFLMGGAFYVLRRLSGSVLLPMAMHGAWDFVSFTNQASGGSSALTPYFQFGTYVFGIVGVIAVFAAVSGRNVGLSAEKDQVEPGR